MENYSGIWRLFGGGILSHSIHINDLLSMILGPVSNVFAKSTRVNDLFSECFKYAYRYKINI